MNITRSVSVPEHMYATRSVTHELHLLSRPESSALEHCSRLRTEHEYTIRASDDDDDDDVHASCLEIATSTFQKIQTQLSTSPQRIQQHETTLHLRMSTSTKPKSRIPRILHQTWKTSVVPVMFQQWRQSWRDNHPGWRVQPVSSDRDNLNLVKHFFPELVDVYQKFRHEIFRVDFIRYLLMYVWGGVYADLDLESLRNMQSLLDDDDSDAVSDGGGGPTGSGAAPRIVLGRECASRNTVDISFLASMPGEIFWLKVARVAIASDGLERIHDVLQVTGNKMFTRVLEQELLAGMVGVVVHDVPVLYAPVTVLKVREREVGDESSGGSESGESESGESESGGGAGRAETGTIVLELAKGYVQYKKNPDACRCGVGLSESSGEWVEESSMSSCRKCSDLFPSSHFVHHETGTWVKTFWKMQ